MNWSSYSDGRATIESSITEGSRSNRSASRRRNGRRCLRTSGPISPWRKWPCWTSRNDAREGVWDAAARIRTWEPLRDETLNLAPFPSLATAARFGTPRAIEKASRLGKVHGPHAHLAADGLRATALRSGNVPHGCPDVRPGGLRGGLLDRRRAQGNHR